MKIKELKEWLEQHNEEDKIVVSVYNPKTDRYQWYGLVDTYNVDKDYVLLFAGDKIGEEF